MKEWPALPGAREAGATWGLRFPEEEWWWQLCLVEEELPGASVRKLEETLLGGASVRKHLDSQTGGTFAMYRFLF